MGPQREKCSLNPREPVVCKNDCTKLRFLRILKYISRLGDRDSECRVSKMFEDVHPPLRRNCWGRRGSLEIALPNKPLVSPHFTLIWPAVPPDWHSQSRYILYLKTNKSSVRYWGSCGFAVFKIRCQTQSSLSSSRGDSPHYCGSSAGKKQPVHLSPLIPNGLPLSSRNICQAPMPKNDNMSHLQHNINNNLNSSAWRAYMKTHVCQPRVHELGSAEPKFWFSECFL